MGQIHSILLMSLKVLQKKNKKYIFIETKIKKNYLWGLNKKIIFVEIKIKYL